MANVHFLSSAISIISIKGNYGHIVLPVNGGVQFYCEHNLMFI
jgi:hypothetical protein